MSKKGVNDVVQNSRTKSLLISYDIDKINQESLLSVISGPETESTQVVVSSKKPTLPANFSPGFNRRDLRKVTNLGMISTLAACMVAIYNKNRHVHANFGYAFLFSVGMHLMLNKKALKKQFMSLP